MKILLAGEGGQGVQLAAEVLSLAAFLEGKPASMIPNFGVEQRGGVSLAFVVIGEEASYPKFEKADILAIFCDRAIERVSSYIDSKTKIIYGPAVTSQPALKTTSPQRVWNMVILGKIIALSGVIKKENIKKSLEKKLAKKFSQNPSLKKLNFEALQ